MFNQQNRLTTKDVKYINKQKKSFFTNFFSFSSILQYPNRKFHQISVHIPRAITKFATTRHFIKRRIINYIKNVQQLQTPIDGMYYKIFINFNKRNIPQSKSILENTDKYERTSQTISVFQKDWMFFVKKLSSHKI